MLFIGVFVFCLSDLVIFWLPSLSYQQCHYGHKGKPASIGQTFFTSYSVSFLWCLVTNSAGFTQLDPSRFSFLLWERKRRTGWMQHWVKVGGCYLFFDWGYKMGLLEACVHAFVCQGSSQGGSYLPCTGKCLYQLESCSCMLCWTKEKRGWTNTKWGEVGTVCLLANTDFTALERWGGCKSNETEE